MRFMLIGLLVIAFFEASRAQSRPTLDDSIGTFRVPNSMPPCGLRTAVSRLARQAKILVGFERTPDCMSSFPRLDVGENATNLAGMTARQALDHLMALAPTYRWKEIDGVAVVRPATAWNDPADALNLPTAPFTVENQALGEALRIMLHTMLDRPIQSPLGPDSDKLIGRPVSVTFPGGTMLDALGALVRAHQEAGWDVGLLIHTRASGDDPAPTVTIFLRTFDTSTMATGTPLPLLQAHK